MIILNIPLHWIGRLSYKYNKALRSIIRMHVISTWSDSPKRSDFYPMGLFSQQRICGTKRTVERKLQQIKSTLTGRGARVPVVLHPMSGKYEKPGNPSSTKLTIVVKLETVLIRDNLS